MLLTRDPLLMLAGSVFRGHHIEAIDGRIEAAKALLLNDLTFKVRWLARCAGWRGALAGGRYRHLTSGPDGADPPLGHRADATGRLPIGETAGPASKRA